MFPGGWLLGHLGPYAGSHHSGCTTALTFKGNVMPVLNANLKHETLAAHKQLSFEQLLSSWLSSAGWEVLIPVIDHGKKTDLVVADDDHYYRIQVKSVQTDNESARVENKWNTAKIHYVVYFSTIGEWGYITPAFSESSRTLNAPGHIRFHKHPSNFLKAFKKI